MLAAGRTCGLLGATGEGECERSLVSLWICDHHQAARGGRPMMMGGCDCGGLGGVKSVAQSSIEWSLMGGCLSIDTSIESEPLGMAPQMLG